MKIDLNRLINGSVFNILYTLVKNKYTFNTSSLTDFKANAFLLINDVFTDQLIRRYIITVYSFDRLIPVNGFNGQLEKPVIF